MRLDEMSGDPPPETDKYTERRAERRARTRSRDKPRKQRETVETTIETYHEVTTKETVIHVNASGGIKATRIDDILKAATAHSEPPPPPPPARTESRDIKQILATHRSRPRRPFNDKPRNNGVKSPEPKQEDPLKAEEPPKVAEEPVKPVKTEPAPPRHEVLDDDDGDNILDKLRKRKERLLNNKPGCCSHERCKPEGDNPDEGPRLHTWPCLLSRYNSNPSPPPPPPPETPVETPPKTPMSPPNDLEKQTLDSLEGLTSVIIKERDEARKERNHARERCATILHEYDGRRQAWQNQLNVVKIRFEHYARRHDKLRNDIIKQQEKFDIERSRMKERHAKQIEGLFGDLFSKIKSDENYIGTSTGLDEVNYKLQAFMEVWKSLAHDVDDLYDKEHYCLRLCETVKNLQEQIKHQNKIISSISKGRPVANHIPDEDLPPPNINVTIDRHTTWEIHPPAVSPRTKDHTLPKFEEIEKLDKLLSPEEDLDELLKQFGPIEDTLENVDLTLDRPVKKREVREVPISPPPPPVYVEVREVPCEKRTPSPLPKPSIDINRSIEEFNRRTDLPIKMDPEEIANSPHNRDPVTPIIEVDSAPVVKAFQPFTSPPMFDDSTLPKETTIDDPAPKPKKKKKKKKPAVVEPPPEPEVEEPVQGLRPRSPSPTPSFNRRRRASLESAKDFSVLGDPDDLPISSPSAPRKETTLDDPATTSPLPPARANGAPPEKKNKKWKPSMPIFNPKLPKDAPKPEPEPEPSNSAHSESPSGSSPAPAEEEPPQPAKNKRAKSLPRFRDPSLPRNMASAQMKRAMSEKDPGSENDSDDSDSDIRSLIESVYMPLHLTPASRAGSKKNVADDAKSEASSFARRNKMPGSMGWLDSNQANTSDEDSSEEDDSSSEEDDSSDEDVSNSESPVDELGEDDDFVPDIVDDEIPEFLDPNRNSMLSSIMKDFDADSKDWLNNSYPSEPPPLPRRGGEILI